MDRDDYAKSDLALKIQAIQRGAMHQAIVDAVTALMMDGHQCEVGESEVEEWSDDDCDEAAKIAVLKQSWQGSSSSANEDEVRASEIGALLHTTLPTTSFGNDSDQVLGLQAAAI